MRNKSLLIVATVLYSSLSFGQETINDLLNIYPPGWGNTHIPHSTGDVYLTGFTGNNGGAFIYRTYNGSGYINRFRITADGDVGVGTNSPLQKLHVQGGNLLISSGSQSIQSELNSSSDYSRFMFNGSNNFIISYGASHSTHRHQLALKANNNFEGSIGLYTNGGERIRIATNGNVGIGTSSPLEKLHVAGNLALQSSSPNIDFIRGASTFGADGAADWRIKVESGNLYFENAGTDPSTSSGRKLTLGNNGNLFFTGNNVGIGVNNPTYKLTVDGVISASEVKVSATPNSDYVFEPDYPLLPLSEVEAHIKEQKHLPGIPSAAEFKQNGVGLGEMDDMLLRKVEELILYTIVQQKELEKLKRENELQDERNNKLLEIVEEMKKKNEALAKEIETIKNK